MRWMLLLAACGGGDASLLGPTTGNPQAAWKQQLASAPAYHGSYDLVGAHERTTGTIAADPAKRLLRVRQTEELSDGKDSLERTLEITIDGTRALMVGGSGSAHHASRSTLPPLEAPEAPFGMIVDAVGLFPTGEDLRQWLLDCLDGTLTAAGPHAWAVKRDPAAVFQQLLARGDSSLGGYGGNLNHPRDRCRDVTLLATDDGTLRGLKGDRFELTFTLSAGATGSFAIDDRDFAKASNTIDPGASKLREQIAALRSDPAKQDAMRASLAE